MNHTRKPPLNSGEVDRNGATEIDPLTTYTREKLEAAFAKLPPFTRSVFLAHRLDDLSYAEIATITGVSVRRIEREMARAIVAIDRAFSDKPRSRQWWLAVTLSALPERHRLIVPLQFQTRACPACARPPALPLVVCCGASRRSREKRRKGSRDHRR